MEMHRWGVSVLLALAISACAQTPTTTPPAGAKTWNPNYENADLLVFIQLVQEATGKTFVIDPRVQGQVTIFNSAPLNADELYKLFLATLEMNGFAAVDSDNIVHIVPSNTLNTQAPPNAQAPPHKN